MMYFRGNGFYPFALDWQEQSNGRQIIPGLGIYFLDPSEGNWTVDEVERQLNFTRAHGLAGEGHYRVKYLMDNTQGLYDILEENYYTAPAPATRHAVDRAMCRQPPPRDSMSRNRPKDIGESPGNPPQTTTSGMRRRM